MLCDKSKLLRILLYLFQYGKEFLFGKRFYGLFKYIFCLTIDIGKVIVKLIRCKKIVINHSMI